MIIIGTSWTIKAKLDVIQGYDLTESLKSETLTSRLANRLFKVEDK